MLKGGKLAGVYMWNQTYGSSSSWSDIRWELKEGSSFKDVASDNSKGCGYSMYSNRKILFRDEVVFLLA